MKNSPPSPVANAQYGFVLFTVLMMIVLLSLAVVSALNLSLSSLGVVKNQNASVAAQTAAQSAIETVISSPAFVADPASIAATPVSIDTNGDAVADYTVTLSASCVAVRPVLQSELNTTIANDLPCVQGGAAINTGIQMAANTASLCSATQWNIRGIATSASTGARAEVNQGVAVRMPIDDAATFCS